MMRPEAFQAPGHMHQKLLSLGEMCSPRPGGKRLFERPGDSWSLVQWLQSAHRKPVVSIW
jgi:hypothetical protein